MPQTDTAAVLAAIDACRKRAIWTADFAFLNKDRPGKTRMEMREIRADLATDSARDKLAQIAADVPLLAAVARAAAELVGHSATRGAVNNWPWWGWTSEDGAGCIGCMGDDDDLDDSIAQTDDWSAFPHDPDCWAMRLDAALAALATGAGTGTGGAG